MSPDQKLKGIEKRNATGEPINRKDVTWLLSQIHMLWRSNEKMDNRIQDLRIAVTNAEDEHKKHHPGVVPPYWLQRFREIAGPR